MAFLKQHLAGLDVLVVHATAHVLEPTHLHGTSRSRRTRGRRHERLRWESRRTRGGIGVALLPLCIDGGRGCGSHFAPRCPPCLFPVGRLGRAGRKAHHAVEGVRAQAMANVDIDRLQRSALALVIVVGEDLSVVGALALSGCGNETEPRLYGGMILHVSAAAAAGSLCWKQWGEIGRWWMEMKMGVTIVDRERDWDNIGLGDDSRARASSNGGGDVLFLLLLLQESPEAVISHAISSRKPPDRVHLHATHTFASPRSVCDSR